ncbi:ammonium transporter [Thiohalophilus sp.]|uniref:ammonium transporter n=1 Tax=Thiohalophilus sp. TaxID=3028392 RepID=UPI002ACDEFB8|nr:ammonium transporter [Thiohalophilus sp.]MDZ7803380.1 ammonium transporter [Thiohalophilus sp.]
MKRQRKWIVLMLGLAGIAPAMANNTAELQQSMDTVWLITAGALVFFMQAGFALLESGMARAKNSVNVVMKNYMDLCLGSLAFWLIGYGLMFGANPTGLLGQSHFWLGNAEHMDYSLLFFQTMFAATAVTIASGAMAERTRYGAYLIGAVIVCAVIYPVYGSWVWGSLYEGSGWLAELGFIDFAGSTVVHSIGGWIALAGIIVLGPRLGRYDQQHKSRLIAGHNLNSVALGGFILWLGWFGFNAGSTASAEASIGLIALNTHLAAAAGAVGALLSMGLRGKPVLLTQTINGGIGGLVSITAGCASMEPLYAVITGLVAGWVVVVGTALMERLRLDDVVGAVPVHGFAGAWGTVAAGLFLTGDLFNPAQVLVQVLGVLAGFAWAFPVALLMYGLIQLTRGLRASSEDEQRGLDYSEHYEIAYPEFQGAQLHQGKNH